MYESLIFNKNLENPNYSSKRLLEKETINREERKIFINRKNLIYIPPHKDKIQKYNKLFNNFNKKIKYLFNKYNVNSISQLSKIGNATIELLSSEEIIDFLFPKEKGVVPLIMKNNKENKIYDSLSRLMPCKLQKIDPNSEFQSTNNEEDYLKQIFKSDILHKISDFFPGENLLNYSNILFKPFSYERKTPNPRNSLNIQNNFYHSIIGIFSNPDIRKPWNNLTLDQGTLDIAKKYISIIKLHNKNAPTPRIEGFSTTVCHPNKSEGHELGLGFKIGKNDLIDGVFFTNSNHNRGLSQFYEYIFPVLCAMDKVGALSKDFHRKLVNFYHSVYNYTPYDNLDSNNNERKFFLNKVMETFREISTFAIDLNLKTQDNSPDCQKQSVINLKSFLKTINKSRGVFNQNAIKPFYSKNGELLGHTLKDKYHKMVTNENLRFFHQDGSQKSDTQIKTVTTEKTINWLRRRLKKYVTALKKAQGKNYLNSNAQNNLNNWNQEIIPYISKEKLQQINSNNGLNEYQNNIKKPKQLCNAEYQNNDPTFNPCNLNPSSKKVES